MTLTQLVLTNFHAISNCLILFLKVCSFDGECTSHFTKESDNTAMAWKRKISHGHINDRRKPGSGFMIAELRYVSLYLFIREFNIRALSTIFKRRLGSSSQSTDSARFFINNRNQPRLGFLMIQNPCYQKVENFHFQFFTFLLHFFFIFFFLQ